MENNKIFMQLLFYILTFFSPLKQQINFKSTCMIKKIDPHGFVIETIKDQFSLAHAKYIR